MAEGAGPASASDRDGDPAGLPPSPWDAPMPASPPGFPADPAFAPTDPEIARPTGGWSDAPTTEAPFFHDLSGAGSSPPGTDPFAPPPPLPVPQAYGSAPAPPVYGAPGYGPPGAGYPGYGYPGYGGVPYGPYAYGAYAPPRNNGLAIASMVCGIVGLAFCQIFCVPALILGFRARRQIRESQGAETGDAFAIAGLVLGGISCLFFVLIIVLYVGLFAFSFAL